MKHLRGIVLSVFVFVCALFVQVSPVYAAPAYSYTVTFLAGNQGSFSSAARGDLNVPDDAEVSITQDKIVITGLHYNDIVNFNAQSAVAMSDSSKYYVKGFRLSGRDNNTVAYSSFKVTGDQDYVVAYGIPGDLTQYTVRYQDEQGNDLAESRTYYGNVGDEPVLAFLYIDGYAPTNMNLSSPLVKNAEENIFTFIYASGVMEMTATATNNADDAGGENPGGAGGNEADENGQPGVNQNVDDTTVIDDENTPAGGNRNPLSTIEDTLTPLAGKLSNLAEAGVLTPLVVTGIALAALIVLLVSFIRRKKKEEA